LIDLKSAGRDTDEIEIVGVALHDPWRVIAMDTPA
jgi:hypothetical protein